ncbi:hypothetical protein VTJ83DRAFT_2979 [Remersonia thermophila]|uniref:MI domain-containing protein n=1 Tax=Remersonia thermophila TaxID=72144 RepID=A0ABR4DCR3_9PEZI
MPPPGIKKPTLPQHLLKELGVGEPKHGQRRSGRQGQNLSRKERRKQERQQARVARTAGRQHPSEPPSNRGLSKPKPAGKPDGGKSGKVGVNEARGKPSSKARRPDLEEEGESFDDLDDFDDLDEDDEGEDVLSDGVLDEGSSDESDDEPQSSEDAAPQQKVPKAVKEKLAQDDREIAELERKLGLRGRKNLPKSFKEDGLGDLLEGLDDLAGGHDEKRKRKAEADEWLAQKRRKAEAAAAAAKSQPRPSAPTEDDSEDGFGGSDDDDDDNDDGDDDMDGSDDQILGESDLEDAFEDDEDMDEDTEAGSAGEDGDDFEGFDSDGEDADEEPPQKRVRENPYVAPTTGRVAKYVPPSLRKDTGSDSELAARVRRQTQGLVNRITESNLLTIVAEIETLYRENPRQHVTSALVDLLLIQVCDSTTLPDTLLILTAGFATAAYMVLGTDFGGQLVQEVVERFDRFYADAKTAALERPDVPKQTSNLITFISQIYTFQLIGPNLVFDYIRMLLDDLSELNAELLLRIVRMCGPTLRQDDPMALKDIVALIPPAVAKVGEKNLSVRTRFMIDTITDLKNNKLKAGVGASALVSEHITRMKKLLGQLKAKRTKSSEPMRMGLKDIQDADKKGKWWLVGASWAGRSAGEKDASASAGAAEESDSDESITLDVVEQGPDLTELAREQGMNTDVRRSIFVSVMSAMDYQDALYRILKLRLNKERQREIPTVLMRCVAAEQHYNPYYMLVAKRACAEYREVRWAFQAGLWKMFGRMGETGLGDDDDDEVLEEDEDAIDMRQIVNLGKMFGALVAAGSLSITILKRLNLLYLQKKTQYFVEVMLVTVLLECQGGAQGSSEKGEEAIAKVFGGVEAAPDLARGLQYFLKKTVRKSDLAGGKKPTKLLKEGCKMAEAVVQAALTRAEEGE